MIMFRSRRRGFWARRGIETVEPSWEPVECYCACHTPVSSRAWCWHCQGDNEVTRVWRERGEQDSDDT